MNRGYLSQYFQGVGAKRLTRVEVDPSKSNQHEFQGINQFRTILGTPAEKKTYRATFLFLAEAEDPISTDSTATWSNVRRDKPHRKPEYHLYYPADVDPLVHQATVGDLLVVATKRDNTLAILIARAGSTWERQLIWLFGLSDARRVQAHEINPAEDTKLNIAALSILDALKLEVDIVDNNWLSRLKQEFGNDFPTTAKFSEFARRSLPEVSPIDDPDAALIRWMEHEELLFRTLEASVVGDRLRSGFLTCKGKPDIEAFIKFSLGVQNRRKARVGFAFENHLTAIFNAHCLRFTRGGITESKARPDFLFPGKAEYHQPDFPARRLTMLGAKSTCKDRWRQVLAEAARIRTKHLITLEPAISINQTEQMQANNLQLVVPTALQSTFTSDQRRWLMNLSDFISLVRLRQSA